MKERKMKDSSYPKRKYYTKLKEWKICISCMFVRDFQQWRNEMHQKDEKMTFIAQ